MSRTKHYSLDDAEVLETKVDQLEKRLENLERFVFSQPAKKEDSSSAQLVQVIASLLERQNKDLTSSIPTEEKTKTNEKSREADINHPQEKDASPLNIDRLRTVV